MDGGFKYKWSPSESLSNDTIANPIASPQATTLYYVTVTEKGVRKCRGIDSVLVTVDDSPDCGWHIYNAFSPNGDGENELWVIDGIERFPENKVMIFNRWGDMVNEFTNYDNVNNVWDGTGKSGGKLPHGTYYYVIEIPEMLDNLSNWVQLTR